ncbi:MAG: hypothetical protein ACTSWN_07370 [Promethearchaeota archaeon]
MKRLKYCFWFLPLWVFLGVTCTRLIIAESRCYGYFGLVSIGIALAFFMFFLVFGLLIVHPIGQLITTAITLIFSLLTWILFIVASGKAFTLLLIITIYLQAWSFYSVYQLIHVKNWRKMINELKSRRKLPKINVILISIVVISGCTTSPLLISQLYNRSFVQPLNFVISDAEAQSYDLVVYFPRVSEINDQIAEIFVEVNATCSIPLSWSTFEEGNDDGNKAAEKIRILNQHAVKVEIWPLFDGDSIGHYPAYNNIEYWDDLYDRFHNWVQRNNLTIDYLLWDIERNGPVPADAAQYQEYSNWPGFLQSIAYFAGQEGAQAQFSEDWNQIVAQVRALGKKVHSDGYSMRATTFTMVADNFDYDDDQQAKNGIPAWAASDVFDYISMMIYRGCEWGGTPSDNDWIFELVRAEARIWKGTIAACLGCINYTPYPNISSVVSDVRLVLAAGLHSGVDRPAEKISIRLFQANSWIDGVGTWQNPTTGNWVYGGPAHGVDNETTSGLRQLLLECRREGEVMFTSKQETRQGLFTDIFMDVLSDTAKPF